MCTEDTEFVDYKDHKVTVKKGTLVHIPSYSIMRDPEHYPNPEVFDPDRFSAENGGLKSYKDKGVYLPFGDGPRICLGMRFGILQVKIAIVEILRNFDLKASPKSNLKHVYDPANFLLPSLNGVWAEFVPLDKANKK